MTFDMIRFGLPNTAALMALAIMPVVALTLADPRPAAAPTEQVEAATICQTSCAQIAAIAGPELVLE
jgi:hypothetical protein